MEIAIQPANLAEEFARKTFFKKTFIGDILLGLEYIQPRMWHDERLLDDPFIWLNSISENPWKALSRLGIDPGIMQSKVAYHCEYESGNTYYWMVPRVIIGNCPMGCEMTTEARSQALFPGYIVRITIDRGSAENLEFVMRAETNRQRLKIL